MVERTLVKSPPELWELLDDEELMLRWLAELTPAAGSALTVTARDPERRLAWKDGGGEAAIDVVLKKRGWGTQVTVTGDCHPDAAERMLDELGSAQRRPFSRT